MSHPSRDTTLKNVKRSLESLDATSFGTNDDRQEFLIAVRSLTHRLENPMEALLRIAWKEPAYAALKIGVDICLFAALGKSDIGTTYTTEELAHLTSTDAILLERILRLLASMDTIAQIDDNKFCATCPQFLLTIGRYLISNPLFQHLPSFLQKRRYASPSDLLDTSWQQATGTDCSFFDWLGQNPEALEMFTNHMAGYTSQRGTWEDVYPIKDRLLDGIEHSGEVQNLVLVDLGGGAGHDLKRFASNFFPTAKKPCLVLQDLPEVIDQANKSSSLPPAISTLSIDFTKEPPVSGSRGYYMHSVLHDWPDSAVYQILRQMHPTLSQITADGRMPKLLLNENVLWKRGVQPQPAALDLIMIAAFASRERSEAQWRSLLESAGYRITGIFSKRGIDEAVIEAEAVPAS